MNIKLKYLFIVPGAVLFFAACVKEKKLEIQKPYTYDEQYYQNLRDYKKTQHTLCFGWYADYRNGAGYLDPASWGLRIKGLPDSMDIISLWSGIPSNDPKDSTSY